MECVYLLQEIDFDGISPTGLYQIGQTSKNAESRKRQYKAGNARRLDTLHTIQVEDAQEVETELHRRLADYRVNHGGGDEWFNFRGFDIAYIIALMDEYEEIPVYVAPTYRYETSYEPYYSRDDDWTEIFSNPATWILICVGLLFGGAALNQSPQSAFSRIEIPISTGYDRANLRSAPQHGNKFIIGQVRSGEPVTAFEVSPDGQWRRVQLSDGRSGWVSNNFVK